MEAITIREGLPGFSINSDYTQNTNPAANPNSTSAGLTDNEVEAAQDDLFVRFSGGNILSDQEFIERSLKENQFWLRIMMEHAFVLGLPLPNEATEYREKSEKFTKSFEKQLNRALHETPRDVNAVKKLNDDSINLLYQAAQYKEQVFKDNVEGKYRGFVWSMLAEHIRREPLYVIKTLQRLNKRVERPLQEDLIEENEFFFKFKDLHIKS